MPVARIHHKAFRVQCIAEHIAGAGRDTVEWGAVVRELHGLRNLEVGNRAGVQVNIERKTLHTGVVLQGATAGATIGQTPPFVTVGVVVEVRKIAEAAIVDRATKLVATCARQGEAIHKVGCGADWWR